MGAEGEEGDAAREEAAAEAENLIQSAGDATNKEIEGEDAEATSKAMKEQMIKEAQREQKREEKLVKEKQEAEEAEKKKKQALEQKRAKDEKQLNDEEKLLNKDEKALK